MRTSILLVLAIAVSGCATPEVKTVFQVKEVMVPVREKCRVQIPQEPPWAVLEVDVGSDPLTQSQAVLADLEQARGYIGTLKAEAKKCE